MTSVEAYAAFLPPERAARVEPPDESWWEWRGHRVHVARRRRPDAPVRMLVVHGAGGHSAALWPLAAQLAGGAVDVDIAAVDLPLYGRTQCPDPSAVVYEQWLELLEDFVAAEHDGRPLVLFGASIGGLIAYEVAARAGAGAVAAVAATCLVDPRDRRVRARITRFGPLGVLTAPLLRLARGRLARVMVPMRWIADLKRMSRDPELSRLCAHDPQGGGSRVPLGFLASYVRHRHIASMTETAPVLLVHPERDDWTPIDLSLRLLDAAVSGSRAVVLSECGHFPVEEPGLTDLVVSLEALFADIVAADPRVES